ncbi:MAG: sigma-70 family RNA polymerase sigma factor, partial [Flavobacteriales bacterium]|nr:sigma-70 family RNA polymerase sigma factor [Flavobacteriales bacterium]
ADEVKEESEQAFNARQIQNAIDQLPAGYRVIVSLYLLEGYDHEEIAQILHISSSTSRSQYNRGKNKLKEMLSTQLWETN